MSSIPTPPRGAKTSGKRLWKAVLSDYELSEHEMTLLRQAVAVADLCDDLQAAIDREGLIVQGRPHPALVESRQQRILLARLIVALRVPMGDEDDLKQRGQYRGTRGVYGIRGAVS